jgi:hypothetical protein
MGFLTGGKPTGIRFSFCTILNRFLTVLDFCHQWMPQFLQSCGQFRACLDFGNMAGAASSIAFINEILKRHPRRDGRYIFQVRQVLSPQTPASILNELLVEYRQSNKPEPEAELSDYLVSRSDACEILANALMGGSSIGHEAQSVPSDIAREVTEKFLNLAAEDAHFYALSELGNSDYIFTRGVLAIGTSCAVLLWIEEND